MNFEKSCLNCRFTNVKDYNQPCVDCKNNYAEDTDEYETKPFLWEPMDTDVVNHPSHYTQGGIECLDAMISAFGKEAVANFCLCNCFKYVWRSKLKNGLEDIEKAKFYLNKYEELTDGE